MYGGGNPRWFYGLSREEQVAVIAYQRIRSGKRRPTDRDAGWGKRYGL